MHPHHDQFHHPLSICRQNLVWQEKDVRMRLHEPPSLFLKKPRLPHEGTRPSYLVLHLKGSSLKEHKTLGTDQHCWWSGRRKLVLEEQLKILII